MAMFLSESPLPSSSMGDDASQHLRLLRQKHPALNLPRSRVTPLGNSHALPPSDDRDDLDAVPDGEVVCTLVQALVDPDLAEAAFAQELRQPCPSCGRRFGAEAALRHFPICKKVHSARQNSWSSEAACSDVSSQASPRKSLNEQPALSSCRSARGRDTTAFASAASVVLGTPRSNCGHGFPGAPRFDGKLSSSSSIALKSPSELFLEAQVLSAR